jgi:predicted GNAT family N-acyltransferase
MEGKSSASDRLRLVIARNHAEIEDALSIRRTVFIDEQGVTEAEEIDAYDGDPRLVANAVHAILYLDERPVATGRLILDNAEDGKAHIGRLAVLSEHRRHGLGQRLMLALQEEAQRRGFYGVIVAAQLQAMPFYQSLGYNAYGGVFLDARIEHRMMEREL